MKNTMKEAFVEWVIDLKPLIHMVVRFKSDYVDMPREQALWHLNWLLHCINRRLFSRHYRQNNAYIKGFVFREKPEGYIHFHLLLMLDAGMYFSFHDAVHMALPRVHLPERPVQVLEEPTIKCIRHYSRDVVLYCLKDVRKHLNTLDLDDIAILDKEGVSGLVNNFETIWENRRNYVFK